MTIRWHEPHTWHDNKSTSMMIMMSCVDAWSTHATTCHSQPNKRSTCQKYVCCCWCACWCWCVLFHVSYWCVLLVCCNYYLVNLIFYIILSCPIPILILSYTLVSISCRLDVVPSLLTVVAVLSVVSIAFSHCHCPCPCDCHFCFTWWSRNECYRWWSLFQHLSDWIWFYILWTSIYKSGKHTLSTHTTLMKQHGNNTETSHQSQSHSQSRTTPHRVTPRNTTVQRSSAYFHLSCICGHYYAWFVNHECASHAHAHTHVHVWCLLLPAVAWWRVSVVCCCRLPCVLCVMCCVWCVVCADCCCVVLCVVCCSSSNLYEWYPIFRYLWYSV